MVQDLSMLPACIPEQLTLTLALALITWCRFRRVVCLYLRLAPSVAAALDVKWLSFTGINNGNSNLLEWSTATEINNDHFDIERSSNGISFEKIGIVKGSGNSSTPLHYQAADNHPLGGNNYYRLRQIDIDGKYTYSVVIIVANGVAKNVVKLYPKSL